MLARTPRGASAPGKLMLSGEYAVLAGEEAIVTAVQRRARVRWSDGQSASQPLPQEAVAARREAEMLLGSVPHDLCLCVRALYEGDRKLGLGSSAAAAVAAAGAVFAARGATLGNAGTAREIMHAANRGHRAVAPRGSGSDVAASALGGVLRVRRRKKELEAEALAWPSGLVARVVWSGQPVRTSQLLDRVQALAQTHPARYQRAMNALTQAARSFSRAWQTGSAAEVMRWTAPHALAMRALGQTAGCEIVTPTLEQIGKLASEAGGVAKPSGAGGGDVAVAFFASPTQADEFAKGCHEHGLQVLSAALGGPGVLLEDAEGRGGVGR